MSGSSQSEHPQDRILRDTRIVTLRIWSAVGLLVICAMLLNVVGVLAPVVEFLAVGSLIAFVESPIVNALEHRGVPRSLGALAGLLLVIAVVALLFTLLLPMFIEQIVDVLNQMPRYFSWKTSGRSRRATCSAASTTCCCRCSITPPHS